MFEGTDISKTREASMRMIRRKMSIVFQDPYSSLDPRMNSGENSGGTPENSQPCSEQGGV